MLWVSVTNRYPACTIMALVKIMTITDINVYGHQTDVHDQMLVIMTKD